MADYALWYFIEGKDALAKVVIDKDKDVFELKMEIQKQWSNSYCKDVDARRLVLLKVRHLKTLHFCSSDRLFCLHLG